MFDESVRDEDRFDLEAVDRRLRAAVPELPGGLPSVRQFHGGVSNRTYGLRYGDARRFVLRRPPPGEHVGAAHDMAREYRLLEVLMPHYPLAPTPILFVEADLIGQPFFLMAHVEGLIFRRDLPEGLSLGPDSCSELCRTLLQSLVALHAVPATGLGDLGRGAGYVRRQVDGWRERYRRARTPDAGAFDKVMTWIDENAPEQQGEVLVHNDFRFDNLILDPEDPTQVRGVLDWELATIGDPLMDLGNSLAYWVQAEDDPIMQMVRRQPTHLPGMWSRAQLVERYFEASGRTPVDFTFYEVMGLFRLAVIAQQIYKRFYDGVTRNERFANFIHGVNYFEQRCLQIIG
ncbi:MAG: phosphotransferase family protein [Myxococcota bacterium]